MDCTVPSRPFPPSLRHSAYPFLRLLVPEVDRDRANYQIQTSKLAQLYVDEHHLYNIQCSEMFTLRYEKLHTET